MLTIRTMTRIGLALALLVSVAGAALATPPGGSLFIYDAPLTPGSPTFEKDVKAKAKKTLTKGDDGWHVYFVAYLKKAPNAPEVNLVFYEAGKKGDPVNNFTIGTTPSAKIMMSDLVVAPDTGIKPGKYDVRVTLLSNGKEDVLARTTLELK